MKTLHPVAAVLMVAFALCAMVALAADLGVRDAAAQYAAQGAPVLQVYARGDAASPALDRKAVAAMRTMEGVRSAVAIAEVPATLSGLNFGLSATVYAVPEEELQALNLPLGQGTLPDSAWHKQALCGANLAVRLTQAAGHLPAMVRLSTAGGGTLDVQLSGVIQPTGTARDDGLWLDADAAAVLLPQENRATPVAITRAEAQARSVAAAAKVAAALRQRGFLVINPVQDAASTLAEGTAMAHQWGVLTLLTFAAAALVLWRRPPRLAPPVVLVALVVAAVGAALAAVLMQTAMLLGARFFVSAEARYLLSAPRWLAVGLLTVALPVAASAGRRFCRGPAM